MIVGLVHLRGSRSYNILNIQTLHIKCIILSDVHTHICIKPDNWIGEWC